MNLLLIKDELLHLRELAPGEPLSFYLFGQELSARLPDQAEATLFVSIATQLHQECLIGKVPAAMKYVPRHRCMLHMFRICYTLKELGYTEFAAEVLELVGG